MNGYLVIGVFTIILAATLYWLQGRQTKVETQVIKKDPEKVIEVVKAKDWVVEEEKEDITPVEIDSESVIEEEVPKDVEDPTPVELEPEPVVETVVDEPKAVEEKDIALLSGVGPKYRSLLKEAGITTVNQVAESDPNELQKLLLETNKRTSITKRPPTLPNVKAWINAAKLLMV